MGNGNATVIAAEYQGNIYPLFDGCPTVNCDWHLPFFEQHGGQWKIALEAEVANNHIYLLQAYPYPADDYERTQVVEKFKIENSTLPTINNTKTAGTETLGWESSAEYLKDYGHEYHWSEFKSNYSFFKKFGGDTTTTAPIDDANDDSLNPDNSQPDNSNGSDPQNPDDKTGSLKSIAPPEKFKRKFVDKITNFNPSTDTLEIDTDSFSINSSATFASGKNKKKVKKQLAKQDFDFLYDQKKGGLYFNENGADKGFGEGGIVAILKGAPDITSGNLEFV